MPNANVLSSEGDSGDAIKTELPRLKIAVLNRVFSAAGGGAERYSVSLVEQLAQRHEIHVFAQTIEHHWPGVVYHPVSGPLTRSGWINQLWFATASWWMTRQGFDIVHSHENTWHGDVQTAHVLPVKHNLLKGKSGLRRALAWLGIVISPRLTTYVWLEHKRFAPQRRRSVIASSPSLAQALVQAYPDVPQPIPVITPGVTATTLAATRDEKSLARKRLGLPPFGPCILLAGNDYRKKGLGALISALAKLPEKSFLAVAGKGTQQAQFLEQARAAGVDSRVFFLGVQKDLTDAYRACDVLAHPTLEDTFAMVVLEAMAHGVPVVVSQARYCGIADLLVHAHDALILHNPQDAAELSQCLSRILSDEPLREHLVANGLAFARQRQWVDIAASQEAVYVALCKPSL